MIKQCRHQAVICNKIYMREPFFVWRWTKLIIVGEVSETLNNFKKKVKQSFQNPSLLVDCKWMFRDVCNLIIKTHSNYVWIYQHRSESKWVALRQLIVLKSFRFDWSTKVAMLIGRLSVKPWCHCLWRPIDKFQLTLTLKMSIRHRLSQRQSLSITVFRTTLAWIIMLLRPTYEMTPGFKPLTVEANLSE